MAVAPLAHQPAVRSPIHPSLTSLLNPKLDTPLPSPQPLQQSNLASTGITKRYPIVCPQRSRTSSKCLPLAELSDPAADALSGLSVRTSPLALYANPGSAHQSLT